MSGYCDKCGNTLCVCAEYEAGRHDDCTEAHNCGEHPQWPPRDSILQWASNIDWRVTTEHDCWGHTGPHDGEPVRWAIYDAGEDDPPIAICYFKDDAINIVEALRAFVARGET